MFDASRMLNAENKRRYQQARDEHWRISGLLWNFRLLWEEQQERRDFYAAMGFERLGEINYVRY